MKATWAKVLVFLFVVTALAVTPANAQAPTSGTVSGTVVDETGAVIPGATVRLTNEETGVTREQETTASGNFAFARVSPGIYSVTITMQGFRTYERTSIDVRVGKVTSLGSVAMEVGAAVEVVTVEDVSAPLMQSESAQITGNYTSEIVTETMLGTFGLDTLAFLTPGVIPGFGNINSNNTFGSSSFGFQIGGDNAISANGLRARFSGFSIDGQDNNDISIGGPGYFVNMFDSVEEYQIATNQFNADQGRNMGASINIITKSGTNEHHGTVYWFHENAQQFNAVNSDPATLGETKPEKFIENFFGFTWGGPIVTDKLFGFGAYQRIKDDFDQFDDPGPFGLEPATLAANGAIGGIGSNTAAIISSSTGQAVNFGNPTCQVGRLAGAAAALVREGATSVDPTGTFAFFDHFDLAGGGSALGVPWCSMLRTPGGKFIEDQFMVKLDWAGEKNSAGGKYMWQDQTSGPFDFLFNGVATTNLPARSQFVNMYHTFQLSPRMLNEFRFSYQRLGVLFEGNPTSSFAPTPLSFPNSEPTKNLGLIIPDAPFNLIGQLNIIPQGRIVNTFQFGDNWSLVWGRHTFKAGVEVRRSRNNFFFLPDINGTWVTVGGLGSFLGGNGIGPNGLFTGAAGMDELLTNDIITVALLAKGPFVVQPFETHQFYFFQDDFRIRPNLTLNLGIRYENFGQPVDGITKDIIERENDPTQAFWLQTLPIDQRTLPIIGSDDNNFAPRVGFAYTPRFWKRVFGEDQTVIRGGYGIAYDVGFENILLNTHTNSPRIFSITRILSPLNVIPGGGTGDDILSAPGLLPAPNTADARLFDQVPMSGMLPGTNNFVNPYVQTWTLGIQREVKGTVAEARYVGTHAIGLFQSFAGNPFFPTQAALFPETVHPAGLQPDPVSGHLFPDRRVQFTRCNCARSLYHGLQTRWDFRNLGNQFTGGVSWTWQKNIDNSSNVFDQPQGGFGEDTPVNPFDIVDNERALSNVDLRHTFTWHTIWDSPWRRDQIGTLGKLAGGWEVTVTGFIFSGRPWTAEQSSVDSNSVCTDGQVNELNCRPWLFNTSAPINSVGRLVPGPGGCIDDQTGSAAPCSNFHWIINDNAAMTAFGNPFGSGRNPHAGDGTVLVNFGIFKNTYANLGERRVNFQFRSQFVNAFNHRNHGVPSSNNVGSSLFANEGARNTGGRIIRFGIRVVF